MTTGLHWFLPTYGDSRLIVVGGHGLPAGAGHSDRHASIDYLASIARVAPDLAHFWGVRVTAVG